VHRILLLAVVALSPALFATEDIVMIPTRPGVTTVSSGVLTLLPPLQRSLLHPVRLSARLRNLPARLLDVFAAELFVERARMRSRSSSRIKRS
jgi:hypothetical protein